MKAFGKEECKNTQERGGKNGDQALVENHRGGTEKRSNSLRNGNVG